MGTDEAGTEMPFQKGNGDMLQDPLTLYKLIVLYMLNRVNFPMTNAQVSDYIL